MDVILNQRFPGRKCRTPESSPGWHSSAHQRTGGESSFAGSQQQIIAIPQQNRDVADLKAVLDDRADLDQQFFLIQDGGRLARDGIDDLKVPCPLPLKGIELRVLQGH